jgi:hypothetical protein
MKLDVQEMDRIDIKIIVLVLIGIAVAVFVAYFFGRLLSGR